MDELIDLERQGWRALSTSQAAAVAFYEACLEPEAVMVFPGGLLIAGRDAILTSMRAQPWASFELEEAQAVVLSPDVGAVVYRARAQAADGSDYVALISSVYVRRRGQWRLALHQQTPV